MHQDHFVATCIHDHLLVTCLTTLYNTFIRYLRQINLTLVVSLANTNKHTKQCKVKQTTLGTCSDSGQQHSSHLFQPYPEFQTCKKCDPRLYEKLRKLSITLLFIPKANSQVTIINYANIPGLYRQGQKTDSNFRDA